MVQCFEFRATCYGYQQIDIIVINLYMDKRYKYCGTPYSNMDVIVGHSYTKDE